MGALSQVATRQQIATAVRAVLGVLLKEIAGTTLADQPPEDIRKRDDDGVNFTAFDFGEQGAQVHALIQICQLPI